MAYRFREAREKAGLSTYEVAKRIGVSQPAVNQWDNGNKLPSVEMLCKLADLYCVSTDYLLTLVSAFLLLKRSCLLYLYLGSTFLIPFSLPLIRFRIYKRNF